MPSPTVFALTDLISPFYESVSTNLCQISYLLCYVLGKLVHLKSILFKRMLRCPITLKKWGDYFIISLNNYMVYPLWV